MPITFLRVSTKSQTLVAASYISFMPFTVENISLLCSQRIGKRNSFVLFIKEYLRFAFLQLKGL